MKTNLAKWILASSSRVPMPIGVNVGLEMTGASVQEAISDPAIQTEAVLALHERYDTPIMLTAMDLSAEAEAFGCSIRMEGQDIPTVLGRLVRDQVEMNALPIPSAGDARTQVHLAAARMLAGLNEGPVLGSLIGPFSLAGRLFGVCEALEMTLADPFTLSILLEKVTNFLVQYATAFREAGASGVIMAEPAAGLLSPNGVSKFSSQYVKRVVEAVQTENFCLILHNCGAKLVHLPRILESGAEIYHFGALMDLPAAIDQVGGREILCGNLDPVGIFRNGTPLFVRERTQMLLEATTSHSNFVISSGCDLPPHTPKDNLDAFYKTVRAAKT